ncbi:lytic transglycosylase domain-containing protein [Mesorhizobium australicum]|uniref:Transglycosylase SLT domain-containing protein n=1 Tax=Mesorhizobium australicum TaxID=536018 RepID=A0A1X7PG22_9HYPH|nr:transglycosylase SLT domain-containing protein [Mesorhizobium australicum]SMH50180.1 Transglycosylase SLT domain-containing protein [Mesorhizobium australicum]
MMKVTIAAAVAASMMSFSVSAQEAPGNAYTTSQVAVSAKEKSRKGEVTRGVAAAPVGRGRMSAVVPHQSASAAKKVAFDGKGRTVVSFDDRGLFSPREVDGQTTGSIPVGKRPELVAKARKGETVTGGRASGSYGDIIARYASTYGVPVSLAHAVIRVESNYRVNARGSAGEVGLMQIKPSTARGLGYSGSLKGLYNPETNIKYGMKYLGMAHKLGGGTTCGTILKYNAGHGAKRMNPVSAAYCSKVKRHLNG